MRVQIMLVALLVVVAQVEGCPIDPAALPSALFCIQTISCSELSSGTSAILVQNCDKSWYYGTTTTPISKLTTSHGSSSKFISNSLTSTSLKATSSYALINFNNSQLYYYPLGTSQYHYQLPSLCTFSDYSSLKLPSGNIMVVMLCSNTVKTIQFDVSYSSVSLQSFDFGHNLTKIECIDSESKCIIGSQRGNLIVFNPHSTNVLNNYTTINQPITIIQTHPSNFNQKYKIYVVYQTATLSEYDLNIKNHKISLSRTSSYFQGQQIYTIGSLPTSNYLIITDHRGNISQIDLSTGILLDSINIEPYLFFKTNIAMSLLLNNQTSYYLFNTANSAIFFASITPDNTKNNIVLSCFDLFYYNNTLQQCAPCSPSCATCHHLTGQCIECINEYFNSNGQCLSCFYDSKGLTDHFDECFSKNQQQMMQTSQAVVSFVSVVVSNFAVFLNLFGLLFIFLKLINNWNIICLYFFVQMELPFFLENVLKMLFMNFSSSVLQTIGIDFKPSILINAKILSPKFQLVSINNDFIAMNTEQIILFIYSVILITTVYKIINYLLAKVKISIFQQNTAISIIEEFVGTFTITLLPFYHVLYNPHYQNQRDKLNSAMYILFGGLCMVIPFCFLIYDYEYKIIRSNKIHNNDENLIAESVNMGLTRRIQAWREDDSKEGFFYALLSITTAVLAGNPSPRIFIFGVGSIHLLSLLNAFKCRQIKVNNIIQKVLFLAYHSLFSSIYFLQDSSTKFKISLGLVLLIILMAVHEIIITFYHKIYFVYLFIKGKRQKEEKVKRFFQKNQEKMKIRNRIHPINIPDQPQKPEPEDSSTQLVLKFKQYKVHLINAKVDEKTLEINKKQDPKRKHVKSVKKIEEKGLKVNQSTSKNQKSLEKRIVRSDRRQ